MPGIRAEVPHYVTKTEALRAPQYFQDGHEALVQTFGPLTDQSRTLLDLALNHRGWDFEQIENMLADGGVDLASDLAPVIDNFVQYPHIRSADVDLLIHRLTH
jgi:hypothetical protein